MGITVNICMKTVQLVEGETVATNDEYTGVAERLSDGSICVRYEANDEAGASDNVLRLSPESMVLESVGAMTRRMEFSPGQRSTCILSAQGLELNLGVETREYELAGELVGDAPHEQGATCNTLAPCESGDGNIPARLSAKLNYDLINDDIVMISNEMTIDIKRID